MLFRYSALLFNAHRIHYDRRYVTEVESYPGLVVHGQLVATCLADLAERRWRKPLASFSFRAQQPLFDGSLFTACGATQGDGVELWATIAPGGLPMTPRPAYIERSHS